MVEVAQAMKLVLPSGHTTFFDEEDSDRILQHRWYVFIQDSRRVLVMREIYGLGVRKSQSMHVMLMQPPVGMYVIHVNYDGLDNRRMNLRVCSPGESRAHARPSDPTNYKGVHQNGNRYRARITINGEVKYLGSFTNAWDAALAYNRAAFECYGELAYLNTRHYESVG